MDAPITKKERTQRMNEYLLEMTKELTDEEFRLLVYINKRKKYQKEKKNDREDSDYDFYS